MRISVPTCAACLVALSMLLPTGESRAYRDGGCILPSGFPRPRVELGGVRLSEDDPGSALKVADRLGIGTGTCRELDGRWMEGAQLGRTALSWGPFEPIYGVLGVPAMNVKPLFQPSSNWGCPSRVPLTADQSSGATQIVRVSALVGDLENIVQVWGWREPLVFGAAFDVPWLGARAREARVDHAWVRMIMPVEPDGLAARWLADGGPRWLGFTLEVSDLAHAGEGLERRGVRLLHATDWKRPMLVVEPDQAGGALVEFVEGAPF